MTDSPDELGRKIAKLYRDLSYPSEAKFRAALRKKGIRVSADFVKEIVQDQTTRQLSAPAPRFTGHVTARTIDQRWAADLMDLTSKSSKGQPAYILVVQDIFSRFLFARPLKSKAETAAAFSRIVEESGRKCEELGTDRGSEFTSASFRSRLANLGITSRLKVAAQDLATLDRAMGVLRATLSRRTAESNNPWHEELEAAVDSMNNTAHAGIYGEEPADVMKDKDLQFDLRYHNAEMAAENQEQAAKRGKRLTETGAFRVLKNPTAFKRAGGQNWSSEVHEVGAVEGGRVKDKDGESFPMSVVKAVPRTSVSAEDSGIAKRGDVRADARRRTAFQPYQRDILDAIARAGSSGLSTARLGKIMADKQGWKETLQQQKATIRQVVELFPDISVVTSGGLTLLFGGKRQARAGTLDAFAQ